MLHDPMVLLLHFCFFFPELLGEIWLPLCQIFFLSVCASSQVDFLISEYVGSTAEPCNRFENWVECYNLECCYIARYNITAIAWNECVLYWLKRIKPAALWVFITLKLLLALGCVSSLFISKCCWWNIFVYIPLMLPT